MKKLTPLALCLTMLTTGLAAGPALALDIPAGSAPEVKSETNSVQAETKTEVQTEAVKAPDGTETTTESKETIKTETGLNQNNTPASPVLENQTSQDKLPTGQSEQPLSGQEATGSTTTTPGNNVQKLFSMFHPKQQADAPEQAAPSATPTTQTQQ